MDHTSLELDFYWNSEQISFSQKYKSAEHLQPHVVTSILSHTFVFGHVRRNLMMHGQTIRSRIRDNSLF